MFWKIMAILGLIYLFLMVTSIITAIYMGRERRCRYIWEIKDCIWDSSFVTNPVVIGLSSFVLWIYELIRKLLRPSDLEKMLRRLKAR